MPAFKTPQSFANVSLVCAISLAAGVFGATRSKAEGTSLSPYAGKSISPAAGMVLSSKYSFFERFHSTSEHPIVSLRNDQSEASVGLSLGTWYERITGDDVDTEASASPTLVTGKVTMLDSSGLRYGAEFDAGDFTTKSKPKSGRSYSTKTSVENMAFFFAAPMNQKFGLSMKIEMAEVKTGGNRQTANLFYPAIMLVPGDSEIIFDMAQADEDVRMDGHWRVAAVRDLEHGTFATGEVLRVKPYYGDDYWQFAFGGRIKSSRRGSMGAEFMYSQGEKIDSICVQPPMFGIRGDMDRELSEKMIVSVGGKVATGSCTAKESRKINETEMYLNGSFTMMF